MVFTPFFISAGVAWCFDVKMVLILFATFFIFLIRKPVEELFRPEIADKKSKISKKEVYSWLSIYFLFSCLFAAPLFFRYQLNWLLLFGLLFLLFLLISIVQMRKKGQRSAFNELVGIAGLCMTAPIGYYVATGQLNITNFFIWCLMFLYYSRSVFYVKLRVRANYTKTKFCNMADKTTFAGNFICIHFFLIVAVYLLSLAFKTQWLIVAYIPISIQCMFGILNMGNKLNVRRLGYIEVFHSIGFGIMIVFICHKCFITV